MRKKILCFLARLLAGGAAYFLQAFMIYSICSCVPGNNSVCQILYYCGLFLLNMALMKYCFDVNFQEILFAGVCGYATQHIAFASIMMIQTLSGFTLPVLWDFIFVRFLPYAAISLAIYFGVVRRYEGKGHDLKHRISKIPGIEDEKDRQEYIESVRGALAIYDNMFQTGNETLDLVLTEKSLLCNEYNYG